MTKNYDKDKAQAEHLKRMAEPEPYRSLRLQKERLEHEQWRRYAAQEYDTKAEALREEIRKLGGKPVA